MRVMAGRQIFFDTLAEGLQSFFVSGMPQKLALSRVQRTASAPDDDFRSLANALCRLHAPNLENIPVVRWNDKNWEHCVSAAVFDAGGRTLREVADKIRDWAGAPPILTVLFFEDDDTDFARLVYDPRQQSDLISEALETLFRQCGERVSALARTRFDAFGFGALEKDFNLFDEPQRPDWEDNAAFELFYGRLSRSWIYSGYPVQSNTIRNWVQQFAAEGFVAEAHQILVYLQQYGFVTETTIVEELVRLYNVLVNTSNRMPVSVAIQKPGKSEQKLAYRLKPTILMDSLADAITHSKFHKDRESDFYCFDDCMGSGDSVGRYLFDRNCNPLSDELSEMLRTGKARVIVLTFHADPRGVMNLAGHPDGHGAISIHPVRVLDESHRAFSNFSRIIRDDRRRLEFRNFCLKVGERLFPGSPLGWQDGQWSVAYDYTVPDNTLPIIYGKDDLQPWVPLFERAR